MTQEEAILFEIEKRGGSITSFDLIGLHIGQYQARLKGLREKLATQGIKLTQALPIKGQKRNFLYMIVKPAKQIEMFA